MKKAVLDLVQRLPADSLEDAQYELDVRQKVERSLTAQDAGAA